MPHPIFSFVIFLILVYLYSICTVNMIPCTTFVSLLQQINVQQQQQAKVRQTIGASYFVVTRADTMF